MSEGESIQSIIFGFSTLAGIILVAVTCFWHWSQKRPSANFPPGPRGWPIIGNMLEFAKVAPHLAFMQMAETYGNIFSVKIGSNWAVVLNSCEAIKEAFLKNAVEFAGRPKISSTYLLSEGGQDISFGPYNPKWKLHRKLVHTAFRNFATGNDDRFENLIFSMTPKVAEILDGKGNDAFDPKDVVSMAIYNFIAQLTFGKQYDFDDPELVNWRKWSEEFSEVIGIGLVADFFPILRHIPTRGVAALKRLSAQFTDIVKREIEIHKKMIVMQPNAEPRDILDTLLRTRQDMIDEGDQDISMISEVHIRLTILDVCMAGTDASIFTMCWAIACLVDHPEIQEKVQKEIDKVIGKERLPRLDDRRNLPYTESTLCEVMRYSSVAPLALPHATTQDVTFGGFFIPKDTWVIPNLYGVHHDKTLWVDPENFRPEHFMDGSGHVREHQEGFLPFSIGHRVCVGETLAKAELFLIFTWLFQNYTFAKPPGIENKSYSKLDVTTIFAVPDPYEVTVTKRN